MTRWLRLGQAILATAVLTVFTVAPVSAQVFFGEDGDGTINTPSTFTNSSAAEASFLSFLTGVGTETFESFAVGTTAPLNLSFPGAGTATLAGNGEIASGVGNGRYPVSGSQFWEVVVDGGGSFTINFSTPIAAFGFYGIDVGDFGGSMNLDFMTAGGVINQVVPQLITTDGAAFFFGYINTDNPFTSIAFNFVHPGGVADFFAFDDMTIGTVEQVTPGPTPVPTPEPGSMLLLATGLCGLIGIARRRQTDDVA